MRTPEKDLIECSRCGRTIYDADDRFPWHVNDYQVSGDEFFCIDCVKEIALEELEWDTNNPTDPTKGE